MDEVAVETAVTIFERMELPDPRQRMDHVVISRRRTIYSQKHRCANIDRGADVIGCVSNTMHRVVGPIMTGRTTPFIHIADPTAEAIQKAGLWRVGILGTMPVMQSEELRMRFLKRFGIEIPAPSDADKAIVDTDELVRRDHLQGDRPPVERLRLAVAPDLRDQRCDLGVRGREFEDTCAIDLGLPLDVINISDTKRKSETGSRRYRFHAIPIFSGSCRRTAMVAISARRP